MAGLVRFSETLRGYVDDAVVDVLHEEHAASGRRRSRTGPSREVVFMLTVVTADVDAMVSDPRHRSPVFGCVLAPVLSPRPLRVERGTLDLFADVGAGDDGVGPGQLLHMRYVLPLVDDVDGRRFVMRGIKEVTRRRAWPTVASDTTTLFVDVWAQGRDDDDSRPPLLRGVLHEGVVGVVQQAFSFRGDAFGLVRFVAFYVRAVLRVVVGRRRSAPRLIWSRVARFVDEPHGLR